ncbi:MAG: LysR family transcriptional regulator [Firmicutes bacterium]|nr:LysR family transcriptional regulator [Bacillota bacterium]
MNLNLLNSFVRVIEKGSLSEAAHDLLLTQPAVSKHLQTLERSFGVPLLERDKGRIRLTEAGEVVFKYSRDILRFKEDMENAIIQVSAGVCGSLVIGASTVPGNYILPSLVGRYKREYPEVKVSLEIGNTEKAVNDLLEQKLDLAFVGAPVKNRRLISTSFEEDQIVLIVPAGHAFAARPSVDLKEVLNEDLVWREKGSGTRTVLEAKLAEKGISLKCLHLVLELGSNEAVLTAVENGLGVSMISRWAIEKSESLGKIKSVAIEGFDMKRSFYMVYPKQKSYSRAIQSFIEMAVGSKNKNL